MSNVLEELEGVNTINFHSMFTTIQGESKSTGYKTLFIRLFGCNLRCSYCDAMSAVIGKQFKTMPTEELISLALKKVKEDNVGYVTITGGEPLLQESTYVLIKCLVDVGMKVNIETNGGVPILFDYFSAKEREYISFTVDRKTMVKDYNEKMLIQNIKGLNNNDELKFVIVSMEAYKQALAFINKHDVTIPCILSPVFYRNKIQDVAKEMAMCYINDNSIRSNVRIGLQTHKFLEVE